MVLINKLLTLPQYFSSILSAVGVSEAYKNIELVVSVTIEHFSFNKSCLLALYLTSQLINSPLKLPNNSSIVLCCCVKNSCLLGMYLTPSIDPEQRRERTWAVVYWGSVFCELNANSRLRCKGKLGQWVIKRRPEECLHVMAIEQAAPNER